MEEVSSQLGEEEDMVKKLENLINTMKDWERKPLIKVGKAIVELGELQDIIEVLKTETVEKVAKAIDDINRRRRIVEYKL